jgi:lysophospholipase L1-like esterase
VIFYIFSGKEIWDKNPNFIGAYNYGITSDSTRQILWRIDNGELDGLNPRALVLTVGTNNMYGDYNDGTDEEIALGIKAILQKIRTKLPNTRILLLSLLPRESPWLVERCENINEAIEKFHDNNWIYFLDVFHDFLESPGFPNKSLFSANLFDLNKAGYEHLANLIEPTMKKIIDYKEAGDITHKKPEHDKPWVPAYGWWGEGIVWKFTHDMLMHQSTVNKSSIEVVFLGDSITQGWSTDGKKKFCFIKL